MRREEGWGIGWCTREKRRARPTRVAHFIYCACCNSAGARPQIESCLCPRAFIIRFVTARERNFSTTRRVFAARLMNREERVRREKLFSHHRRWPASCLTTTRACAIRDNGGLVPPVSARVRTSYNGYTIVMHIQIGPRNTDNYRYRRYLMWSIYPLHFWILMRISMDVRSRI